MTALRVLELSKEIRQAGGLSQSSDWSGKLSYNKAVTTYSAKMPLKSRYSLLKMVKKVVTEA